MKRSETPEDLRKARHAYIDTRWTQLSDLSAAWGEEAIKYLLVVNTGAMAGTLSFIGAMPHLRPLQWPKTILLLFAIGVVLVGIYHAVRYHRIEWLFRSWRQAVADYVSDKIEWNELLDRDEYRSKRMTLAQAFVAYSSLICFLAGLFIAAVNFDQITNPPPKEIVYERTKAATTNSTAADTSKAGAEQNARTEAVRGSDAGKKDRSAQGSATGSGSTATAEKR